MLALGGPWCRPCLGDIFYGCRHREKMVVMTAVVLLAFITQAGAQQSSPSVFGAVGGVVYLNPSPKDLRAYSKVHWRHNNTVRIATRDNGDTEYPSDLFKGRLELFSNNTLKISSLQKNDSSEYQVYLEDETGREDVETIQLTVLDLVPKPIVEAEVTRDDSLWCSATLKCSVGIEGGVTYEWISVDQPPLSGEDPSQLKVSHRPSGKTYICRVSNPVSFNSASLTYRQPCTWTAESSAPASYTMTSMMVALGLPLLLLTLA